MLQKEVHVGDSTLTSLFIAGLIPSIKQELLTRRPSTLLYRTRSRWHSSSQLVSLLQDMYRPLRQSPPGRPRPYTVLPTPYRDPQTSKSKPGQPPTNYPVVRISTPERAQRAKLGLSVIGSREVHQSARLCQKVLCPNG